MSKETTNRGWTSRIHPPPAFRSAAYRLYFPGLISTAVSLQAFQVGLYWLAYELTGSPVILGIVGTANALPTIIFTLMGGVAADKFNKRYVLIATSTLSALVMAILATLTLFDLVQVWHLIVMAILKGTITAFDVPLRNAIYPALMRRSAWTSGIALDSSVWWSTSVIAPALSGLIISVMGTEAVFFVASAGMLVSALVMYTLRLQSFASMTSTGTAKLLGESLRFIAHRPTISFLLGIGFFASFFGTSYIVLMPVFATEIFDVGPTGFGILLGAGSAGAVFTSIWVGAVGTLKRRGALLIGGIAMSGITSAAFGFSSWLVGSFTLGISLMLLVGIFSSLHGIASVTSLQLLLPDHMRGRVMGIHSVTYTIPTLGAMPLGAIASLIGAPIAVGLGGISLVIFALGPMLANKRIRKLSAIVHLAEKGRDDTKKRSSQFS